MNQLPEDLRRLDQEVSGRPRLDPGGPAVLVSVGVLLLLGAVALPWVGPASGWSLLMGADLPFPRLGLPRFFAGTSVLFGVVVSALALSTRLWALGWAAALGCGFTVVTGVWAIWSRQTAVAGTPGPGIGLLLSVLVMALIAGLWVRIAWTRPGGRANG
jgi:hypothetical protein